MEVWTPFVIPLFLQTRCCVDGPSELRWTPHLLRILLRLPGFLLGIVGAGSSSAAAAVVKSESDSELDSEPDFLEI